MQHEALINVAFAECAVSILCPYDVAHLDPDVVADAATTHPVLVDRDARRSSLDCAEPATVVEAFNRPLPEPGATPRVLVFGADGLPAVRVLVCDAAAEHGLSGDRRSTCRSR